jgi:hypothetical protein
MISPGMAVLEAKLFLPVPARSRVTVGQIEPDWASIHRELKRKYVIVDPLGRIRPYRVHGQ